EREVRRFGLRPGGENGTYFQTLPYIVRALDSASAITVNGQTFAPGVDFVAQAAGTPEQLPNLPVVWGGTAYDTTSLPSNDDVRGKIVVIRQAQGTTITMALLNSE